MPALVKACRTQPSCKMTDDELSILEKIHGNLPIYTENTIQFKSENEDPSLFNANEGEAHRVAVTGDAASGHIIFNSDRIENLSLTQMAALLAHEITHHAGIKDDMNRIPDQIGAKMAHYFESHSVSLSLEQYQHPEIQIYYFGVSPPEKGIYYQYFREPANAAVAIMDADQVFDVIDLTGGLIHPCDQYPGTSYTSQQISNPFVRVASFKSGDPFVQIDFHSDIMTVCLDAKTPRLIGVPLINEIHLHLKLQNPQVTKWQDSALRLMPENLQTEVRESRHTDHIETGTLLEIQSVKTNASQLKAGETWRLEVLANYSGNIDFKECNGGFINPHWQTSVAVDLVAPIEMTSCHFDKLPDGQYRIFLDYAFPANANPASFELKEVGLIVPGTSRGVILGVPTQKISVQITNDHPTLPVKISSVKILGAGDFTIHPNQIYEIEVRFENGQDLYYAFIRGNLRTTENQDLPLTGSLDKKSFGDFFKGLNYRYEGTTLIATYQFSFPQQVQSYKMLGFFLSRLQFVTESLEEIIYTAGENPDFYFIR